MASINKIERLPVPYTDEPSPLRVLDVGGLLREAVPADGGWRDRVALRPINDQIH